MNHHSFDKLIIRDNTNSVRWDFFKGTEVIPLTVADMDFEIAPEILTRLIKRMEHGVFGYTHSGDLVEKIQLFLLREYGWYVDYKCIIIFPNVLNAIRLIPKILLNRGDHVLIPAPVYPQLFNALNFSGINYSLSKLILKERRWTFDFNHLESLVQSKTRLLMLCNPHNPVGTVYSKFELERLGEFCQHNNITICSDEIHAQLVIDRLEKHIPIASINSDLSSRAITLMSLNKVFNISGLGLAWCVCSDSDMRRKIIDELENQGIKPNIFAYEATTAAIEVGQDWRDSLLTYLWGNQVLIREWLGFHPLLSWSLSAATHLAWIKFDKEYSLQSFVDKGVALIPGIDFGGDDYSHFLRLNYAMPREKLLTALARIDLVLRG